MRGVLERHARGLEASSAAFEARVGGPMAAWSREKLEQAAGATVFYPFSGPDFVTVHRFYPAAGRYVLVAMQEGGPPPELGRLSPAELDATLSAYRRILETFDRRGFFVTAHMGRGFLMPTAVAPGISGVLLAFAAREGYEPLSITPVRVAASGAGLEAHPGDRRDPRTWRSVRLLLRRPGGAGEAAGGVAGEAGGVVALDYLMLDLGDASLRGDAASARLLEGISAGPVVIKAASHLPQMASFSRLRELLLGRAREIVQDETGIAYALLRERFDVRLFGRFRGVNQLFDGRPQRALALAYKEQAVEVLPFAIGYHKAAGASLQVARRK
jgi:hypothetical protein